MFWQFSIKDTFSRNSLSNSCIKFLLLAVPPKTIEGWLKRDPLYPRTMSRNGSFIFISILLPAKTNPYRLPKSLHIIWEEAVYCFAPLLPIIRCAEELFFFLPPLVHDTEILRRWGSDRMTAEHKKKSFSYLLVNVEYMNFHACKDEIPVENS